MCGKDPVFPLQRQQEGRRSRSRLGSQWGGSDLIKRDKTRGLRGQMTFSELHLRKNTLAIMRQESGAVVQREK